MFRLYRLKFYQYLICSYTTDSNNSNHELDKSYLKGLESFQFGQMDIPFTNSQIKSFQKYDSLHSIFVIFTNITKHNLLFDET